MRAGIYIPEFYVHRSIGLPLFLVPPIHIFISGTNSLYYNANRLHSAFTFIAPPKSQVLPPAPFENAYYGINPSDKYPM